MSKIILQIYIQPLENIIITIVISCVLWVFMGLIFRLIKKEIAFKIINRIILLPSLFVILYLTIIDRNSGDKLEVVLRPFYSFVEAKNNEEMYRTMLMNVFLFVPLGLTLTYSLPHKIKHNIIVTIVLALFLSTAVETVQYIFALGRVETDDVICNTFGAFVGALAYFPFAIKIKGNKAWRMKND